LSKNEQKNRKNRQFSPYESVGIYFADISIKERTNMANGVARSDDDIKEGSMTYIHPAWYSFIKYCETLRYGEIDKIKIQDGLPMIAEEVKKKIKFSG
jgi:hypothetical protein